MGVPHMVSDVGGMSELVDLERYSEAVVPHGSEGALAVALQTALERGTLPVLPLRQTVRLPCTLAPCPLVSDQDWDCAGLLSRQVNTVASICIIRRGPSGMC